MVFPIITELAPLDAWYRMPAIWYIAAAMLFAAIAAALTCPRIAVWASCPTPQSELVITTGREMRK